MSDRLKGKAALITGGTSGIGAATAELFVNEGASVAIAGRSEEKGQALADAIGAKYLHCDVTREEDIAEAIDQTTEAFGRLDILFNNAGGPVGAPIDKLGHGVFAQSGCHGLGRQIGAYIEGNVGLA